MDITGKVLGVTGHPTQRGTRYAVAFSDGNEYSTFENELAQRANALVGQDVDIRVNITQKPSKDGTRTFTNRYINDIAPTGQLPPEDLQAQAGATVAEGGIPIIQPQQRRGGGGGSRGMTDADKERISKLGALGDAFAFVGSLYASAGPEALDEAKGHAFALAREIYNEARAHEIGQATVVPQTTPEAVAAAIPGVQVGTETVEAGSGTSSPTPQW